MKVAIIAPVEETIPPQKYGGIEWIVYHVAHGIGKKGHSVDLFATGDSQKETEYNLISVTEKALRIVPIYYADLKLREEAKLQAITKTYDHLSQNSYDVIHNHAGWRFLQYANRLEHKVLTTHHGPLSIADEQEVFIQYKDHYHISISNNQRKDLPQLNFVETIYNGTDTVGFPFYDYSENQSYMIFLARMSEEKGAVEAAKAARATKHPLIVHTKIDKVNELYFEQFKNYVDNNYVRFGGEVDFQAKVKHLGGARCLLVPVQWEEPFGLMFTEAMSCGTPVITFARGSAPEIIRDGETGFLVNQSEKLKRGDWIVKKTGVEGLCEAIERIFTMSILEYRSMRRKCREHVEKNFTVEKMVDEYEKVYKQILNSELRVDNLE